jgi:hypothetical protein
LHGRFDRLVGKKCVEEITSAQPGCQVRWFDASHMLLETHADEAAKAINEFCEHLTRQAINDFGFGSKGEQLNLSITSPVFL